MQSDLWKQKHGTWRWLAPQRREAGRSHWARRSAIRPVAPGISPRKSKTGLGKQRRFGGGRVRYTVITNPYTFTGRRLDDETGLFYYRNRYYHAQLGRFVTRDPIGYEGGGWNLYAAYFVPNRVDPHGTIQVGYGDCLATKTRSGPLHETAGFVGKVQA